MVQDLTSKLKKHQKESNDENSPTVHKSNQIKRLHLIIRHKSHEKFNISVLSAILTELASISQHEDIPESWRVTHVSRKPTTSTMYGDMSCSRNRRQLIQTKWKKEKKKEAMNFHKRFVGEPREGASIH